MAGVDVNGIVKLIIDEAISTGGDTWNRIKKSMPLYTRGYAQNLADIAEGVASGEISAWDGAMYTQNAELILIMAVANTAQVIYFKVQQFINKVLSILKGAINSKLPVPLLGG